MTGDVPGHGGAIGRWKELAPTEPPSADADKRVLAKNIAFTAFAQTSKNACLFLANLIILKVFGEYAHGGFAAVVAISYLVTNISDLGLGTKASVREIARQRAVEPGRLSRTISESVSIQLTVALILALPLLAFARPIAMLPKWFGTGEPLDFAALTLAGAWVPLAAAFRACMMIATGFERMSDWRIMGPTTEAGKLLTVAVCAALRLPLIWIFVGWTIAHLAALALAGFRTRQLVGAFGLHLRPTFSHIRHTLGVIGRSVPYYLPFLGQSALGQVPLLLIAAYHPRRDVSVFNVCFSLTLVTRLVALSFSTAIFPRMASLGVSSADAKGQSGAMIQQVSRLLGLAGTLVFAGFWLVMPLAFGWFYKDPPDVTMLLVLTFAMAVDSYAQQLDQVLMALGHVRAVAWLEAIKYALIFGVVYAVVPDYGGAGAAVVICAGVSAGALVKTAFTRLAVGKAGEKPLALTLATFAVLTGVGLLPKVGPYLCLPAWLIAVLALGLLRPDEIRQWTRLLLSTLRRGGTSPAGKRP